MSFRLWTIFYVFAVLATAIATFGPGGIFIAAIVLVLWTCVNSRPSARVPWSGLLGFLLVGTLVVLIAPTMSSVREAALRSRCANNLKQIALALLNYEAAKGVLPPAYLVDANGKPTHSWRVLILPFLGENVLYAK